MKNANPSFALMQKAVALHQKGQVAEAEAAYRQVLNTTPRHADALRLLGGLYLQINQAEQAIPCLQQALSLTPNQPELLNNLGVALCSRGQLNDALQCYQQAIQIAPNYAGAIDNLGQLYYSAGKLDDAATCFERSLQLNAQNPGAYVLLGDIYQLQGSPDKAIARYQEALRQLPDHPDILTKLGNLLRDQGRSAEACAIYQRLAQLKPNDVSVHLNLGVIYRDMGDLNQALTEYDAALKLKPDALDVLVNRAGLLVELDRPAEAAAAYDAALALNPRQPAAQWGKSLALLMQGDYADGWRLYETRFAYKPKPGPAPRVPRWQGEPLAGKELLIWGEQGLGDVLQFVRYARLCHELGAQVTVQCDAALTRLLGNCPSIAAAVNVIDQPDFDFQIPVMSLPHRFGTTLATIPHDVPYLYVSDAARAQWQPYFVEPGAPRIGLVWAGNPRKVQIDAHATDRQRSLTLDHFRPLLTLDGYRFYNLQKGEANGQLAAAGLQHRISDPMGDVADFMDTAAIIENLDLVISVDTSVVHLAGALGKPVWVLSRFGGCWRWLRNQPQSPWYPTARIFGQTASGDWSSCIAAVTAALQERPLNANR